MGDPAEGKNGGSKPKMAYAAVMPRKAGEWMFMEGAGNDTVLKAEGGWRSDRGRRGHEQRDIRGQLCLPAGPNILGFFATEGLKVHPTRSQQTCGKNGNTNKHTKKKQSG
ncbi:hypothetical protein KIL84_008045 [Mauremys mutica]|uniref:Uncharacterized protein n=1 Tax=Mauremys mutica TaxID=74926 RepID=A0A9D3X435_9SAUR|nr:hypothetical protein KIL84_008045 [Mauremys mutica]